MRKLGSEIKITVNSHIVCYNDHGPEDAPVIIFIHGFPNNKSMWDNQLNVLKENYRVIAYDVHGNGTTQASCEDFSIGAFDLDLLNFMDALNIEKSMLCGLSEGGFIALSAIEKYPERFSALILSNTDGITDSPEAKVKRRQAIEIILKNGLNGSIDKTGENVLSSENLFNDSEEKRVKILKTSRQWLCRALLALSRRKEIWHKMPDIQMPVLIIAGREDKVTQPDSNDNVHSSIKGSILKFIDHAGHLINLDNPDQFNSHMLVFVSSVKAEFGK